MAFDPTKGEHAATWVLGLAGTTHNHVRGTDVVNIRVEYHYRDREDTGYCTPAVALACSEKVDLGNNSIGQRVPSHGKITSCFYLNPPSCFPGIFLGHAWLTGTNLIQRSKPVIFLNRACDPNPPLVSSSAVLFLVPVFVQVGVHSAS